MISLLVPVLCLPLRDFSLLDFKSSDVVDARVATRLHVADVGRRISVEHQILGQCWAYLFDVLVESVISFSIPKL